MTDHFKELIQQCKAECGQCQKVLSSHTLYGSKSVAKWNKCHLFISPQKNIFIWEKQTSLRKIGSAAGVCYISSPKQAVLALSVEHYIKKIYREHHTDTLHSRSQYSIKHTFTEW